MKSYAYAKLNLALKILGQRPDGYHSLDMLMQRISLYDELTIQKLKLGIEIPANRYELAAKYGIKTILSGGNVATESIIGTTSIASPYWCFDKPPTERVYFLPIDLYSFCFATVR